jgi:outer membrane protein assembly factor BamE
MIHRSILLGGTCCLALVLGGCGSLDRWSVSASNLFGLITPYRIDIVQGNVVTKEQLALLKTGMSRSQVRDVLGSPMLTDPFHADRWDYIFAIRRPGTEPQRRSVVVHFKADQVERIEAPELPGEREFVASIVKPSGAKPPKLELTEAERAALPKPPPQAASAAAPAGPVRSYPPLEPTP